MLKDKNILFLVHSFTNFQKDQIEDVSKYFRDVYVIVRYKPLADLLKFLKLSVFKNHELDVIADLSNLSPNVHVYMAAVWYLPTEICYRLLGTLHYYAVNKLIRKYKINFDIIHAHFLWTAGYVGTVLKRKYKVPLIVTGHGYDVYELPFLSTFWKKNIGNVIRKADAVTTVSYSNKKCIEELTEREDINVITNGYSNNKFFPMDGVKARKALGLSNNNKIIISVGNLEKVKGHIYLIKAMKSVLLKNSNILCYIIGEGSQRATLANEIIKMKLQRNVFLIGQKPHLEINMWLNASDLLVLPSVAESFGVVQIEAMACGKPVVATLNGGSEEIIIEGNTGYLCINQNPNDLSSKITLGLSKNWDRNNIIKQANKYLWGNITKKYLRIYTKQLPSDF